MDKEILVPKIDKNIDERNRKTSSRVLIKIVLLNIVNVILIVVIFVFLSKLPGLGEDLKTGRSSRFTSQGGNEAAVLQSEIDRNQEKIDSLKNLYVDASGFADFVGVINTMQNEGLVTGITISGDNPVENTKKQLGIPIAIVFQGSEEQINSALRRIYELPVLFSTTNVEIEGTPEAAEMRFSMFLLVDEQFSQN